LEHHDLPMKLLLSLAFWALALTWVGDEKYAQAGEQDADCASLPSLVFKTDSDDLPIALAKRCYQGGDAFAHSYVQSLYLAHLTDVSEDTEKALMGPDDEHSPESYLKALMIRMLTTASRPAYSDHFYRQEYLGKAVEGGIRAAKLFTVYQSLAKGSTSDPQVEFPDDMGMAQREAIQYFGDGCVQIGFSDARNDEFLAKYWTTPEYPQMIANHVAGNCGYAIDFAQRNSLDPQLVGEFFVTMARFVYEQSRGLGDSMADIRRMTAEQAAQAPPPEVLRWMKNYKEHAKESPLDWCDQYLPDKSNLCYRVAFKDHFNCMSVLSMPASYDVRHSAEYDLCRVGEIAKFRDALLN